MRKELAAAMQTWIYRSKDILRLRAVAYNVVMRMRHRLASNCLFTWSSRTQKQQRQTVAFNAIIRMGNRLLVLSMMTWRDHAKERRRIFMVAQNILRRMSRLAQSKVFSSWRYSQLRQLRMKGVVKRVVLRICNRLLASALDTWVLNSAEERRQSMVIYKVIMRLHSHTIAVAMDSWCSRARQQRRQRDSAKKVVLRNKFLTSAIALHSWLQNASEQRRVFRNACIAVRKILYRILWSAFVKWSNCAHQLQRRKRLCEKANQQAEIRVLVLTIDKWHLGVVKFRRQLVAGLVIRKLCRCTLAGALRAWLDCAAQKRRLALLVEQMCMRTAHNKAYLLAIPISRWYAAALSRKQRLSDSKRLAERADRAAMASALFGWRDLGRAAAELKDAVDYGSCRARLRLACAVLRAWGRRAASRHLCRGRLLAAVLRRLSLRSIAFCLRAWNFAIAVTLNTPADISDPQKPLPVPPLGKAPVRTAALLCMRGNNNRGGGGNGRDSSSDSSWSPPSESLPSSSDDEEPGTVQQSVSEQRTPRRTT